MNFVTRREFREVLLALYEDIQKLREKVTQNRKREEEGKRPIAPIALIAKLDPVSSVEFRTPIEEQKHERKYQFSSLLIHGFALFAAVSAAIGTGIYARITYRMWCEMREQTMAASRGPIRVDP